MVIFNFIAHYLGKFLYIIYKTIAFNNYGIALILFTIFIKLALLPLSLKQYHSTQKMQEIQPEIQKIQKRYKNDKEKMNQEMMKLYQEKGVNPAGGCLPLLVQLPILFSLFYVIRRPITYMLGISKEKLGYLILKVVEINPSAFEKALSRIKDFDQIKSNMNTLVDKFARGDLYFEVHLLEAIKNLPEHLIQGIENIKLTFMGIFNLGLQPTMDISKIKAEPNIYIPLLILVLIATVTTFLSSKMSITKNQVSDDSKTNAMGKNMMYIGPLMTLWVGFAAPAGIMLYWTVSNIIQVVQQWYINNYVIGNKEESGRE